jgi:hypothetical protein
MVTRRWKYHLLNAGHKPPEMLKDGSNRETGCQSFREATLLSRQSATQLIHIPRLSPKNKGGLPYIPFRAGYWNGGYSLSHTRSHTISLATLTSVVRWPFSGLTPGDIPQICFFKLLLLFHPCTHYLSSPSLPSCHTTMKKRNKEKENKKILFGDNLKVKVHFQI